jgi:hypothetical protein
MWDSRLKWSASTVSRRLWKPLPQFQWDCGSGFGGFNETTESLKSNIIFPQKGSFSIKLCFKKFGVRSLYDTAEADLAVSMRPRSGFSGINETAEADSVALMRPQKPIQRSQWGHRSGFSGLNDTAESLVTPHKPTPKRISALNSFKGIL